MKKWLLISALFICLNGYSQTSVKPKIDSIKKVDTLYAVVLKKDEFYWFINLIKIQDEKPSIINQQIQQIYQKTQLVLPNKEIPKK
jgi:hypothetical protein